MDVPLAKSCCRSEIACACVGHRTEEDVGTNLLLDHISERHQIVVAGEKLLESLRSHAAREAKRESSTDHRDA